MNKIIALLVLLALVAFKSEAFRSTNTAYDLELDEDEDFDMDLRHRFLWLAEEEDFEDDFAKDFAEDFAEDFEDDFSSKWSKNWKQCRRQCERKHHCRNCKPVRKCRKAHCTK